MSDIQSTLELGDLEVDIFRMCNLDKPFLVKMMTHLKPEYFSSDTLKFIFKIYKRFFDDMGSKIPPRSVIENMIQKTKHNFNKEIVAEYLDRIFDNNIEINLEEREYITKQVVTFAKHSRMVEAVTESYRVLGEPRENSDENVFEQVVSLVRDALMFNIDVEMGYDLYDVDLRYQNLRNAHLNKIPSGYNQIDSVLEGGWSRKELYCFMGPPGIGKCQEYNSEIEIEIDENDQNFNMLSNYLIIIKD